MNYARFKMENGMAEIQLPDKLTGRDHRKLQKLWEVLDFETVTVPSFSHEKSHERLGIQ